MDTETRPRIDVFAEATAREASQVMPVGTRGRRLRKEVGPALPQATLDPGSSGQAQTSFRRDAFIIIGLLIATVVLSSGVLWWVGVLGSGVWENSDGSRVVFVGGDSRALDRFCASMPNRPLALVFFSETCLHCKQMREPFLASSRILSGLTFVAVETNSNLAIARAFHLKAVPVLLYLPSSSNTGKFVKFDGPISHETVRQFLDKQLVEHAA
jgi:Thioredoxin